MVILHFYSALAAFVVTKGNFKHLSRSGYIMTNLFSMLSTKIFRNCQRKEVLFLPNIFQKIGNAFKSRYLLRKK